MRISDWSSDVCSSDLIDSYTHLVDEKTQRSLGMEITLSKWFFDGVVDRRNILSISPLYFEITSGLGKWLYRAARKHAGGNGADGFTIGFQTLQQQTGSESRSDERRGGKEGVSDREN